MVQCKFLENVTIKSLIAPVAEEEFRTQYWEKKPLVVHRNDPGYYGDLFTLQDFDEAMTRVPRSVKTANAADGSTLCDVETTLGLEAVLAAMRDGNSIVMEQMHKREPKLGLLCRQLGQELGHYFQTNLYLSPPRSTLTAPHWDNHDGFILQMLGSKHWQIEHERRILPEREGRTSANERKFRTDRISFTLNQGDMVYIPRGFVHAAKCGSDPSLHITLGVIPVTMENLLNETIKAAVARDNRLRLALPLGFMHGKVEGLVNDAMAALQEIADQSFISSVVDDYRDKLVKNYQIDISGQIVDILQPTPLMGGDIVGPRPGIVYRLHVGDDSIHLYFGARTIVFPSLFHESLNFSLNTHAYAIREIAGDLEDEERVVFIERLMQEGLVVRK